MIRIERNETFMIVVEKYNDQEPEYGIKTGIYSADGSYDLDKKLVDFVNAGRCKTTVYKEGAKKSQKKIYEPTEETMTLLYKKLKAWSVYSEWLT